MQFIFVFALIISVNAIGQNIIRGRVLTIMDSNPIPGFVVQFGKKQFTTTDSTGSFSISTKKRKKKLSFPFARTKSKDTTIFISDSLTNFTLLSFVTTWDSSQAKYDIQNNTMLLFCCSGFYVMFPGNELEKKFGVKYSIIGDDPPARIEKLRTYNSVIIQYLDKKYGEQWRKIARGYRI
jgi:hypothetical protein